jgi:hypothetical protein
MQMEQWSNEKVLLLYDAWDIGSDDEQMKSDPFCFLVYASQLQ